MPMSNREPKKAGRNERIISEYLAGLGKRGGKTTAARMTAEERSQRARKAVLARYGRSPKAGAK